MTSGVCGTGSYSTLFARLTDKRVDEYYAAHADDGRAVLMGDDDEPHVWLTRPDVARDTYCLCWARRDGIYFTTGETSLRSLGRAAKVRLR